MRIDTVVDIKTHLGEGPVWDVDTQRLYWVDSAVGNVYRATATGTELRAWDLPGKVGSLAIRRDGDGAVVAIQSGFHFLDFATGDTELIADPEPDLPLNRFNDGKVDRRGRFLAGTMDTREESPTGSLYRLDPDLSVHRLEEGIIVSNGPCWSPDSSTFYFADSWSGEFWAYDYDLESGAVANRRTFARIDSPGQGAFDGATVDAEGCIWHAQVFDGLLVRHTPAGDVDRVIPMPVRKVTSVTFGGPDLDILFVTSMAKPPLPQFPGDGIERGAVFAITGLGVTGLPENRFGA
jgi:L-arabinonolactonase